jgi:peptidoglycan hydrolase-like protein with peptidoglycan-binding domain
VADGPVGNPDAFAVQKKLAELGLFNGKVDGFYGPMTANAIRLFETRNGLTPTGALSRQVIDAILGADAAGQAPVQPQAAVAPQPVVVQQPPPVPQAAQPAPQQDQVVARLPELSPVDQAVDTIGTAAAQTLDSIVAVVDGSRSTPTNPIPALPLVAPEASQPMPVQLASLEPAAPAAAPVAPANNTQLVSSIQIGLASLGFYHGTIDGHPGDATARAIREFENFHSYRVTGQVKPDLVGLLRQAGAELP